MKITQMALLLVFIIALAQPRTEVHTIYPLNRISSCTQFTPHLPILIEGNAEFAAMASSENWTGSGSNSDPFNIHGLAIRGPSDRNLIEIRNTDVHFRINACELAQGLNGIFLFNVINCYLSNNIIIENNENGILMEDGWEENKTWDNIFTENVVANNTGIGIKIKENNGKLEKNLIYKNLGDGIELGLAGNSILTGNTITDNGREGITLVASKDTIIEDNTLRNNSLAVYPYPGGFDHFGDYFQTRVTNNTVNGKPLVYWQNVNGEDIPYEAGQIILINCSNIQVIGQTVCGIDAVLCNELLINANQITNGRIGIRLEYTQRSTVSDNWINRSGIFLSNSQECIITHNTVNDANGIPPWDRFEPSQASGDGIHLSYSDNCLIANNTVTNAKNAGISVRGAFNDLYKNVIIGSDKAGIALGGYVPCPAWDCYGHVEPANNCVLINNLVIYSNETGINLARSDQSILTGNIIANNTGNGIALGSFANNNNVHYNNIQSNYQEKGSQAIDNGYNNSISTNYWNDWTEPDEDDNGIVDEPYHINGTAKNQDLFPLVSPYNSQVHLLFPPRIMFPNGREILSGTISINWFPAFDSEFHNLEYAVYYSPDAGNTWILIAENVTNTELTWNLKTVPSGANYMVKVITTCSNGLTASDISDEPFSITDTDISTTSSSHDHQSWSFSFFIFLVTMSLITLYRKRRSRKFLLRER